MKPLFVKSATDSTRLFFVVLLSVVVMTLDHRFNYLEQVRGYLGLAVAPIHYVVDLPISSAQFMGESLTKYSELLANNAKLRSENLLLLGRLQRFEDLKRENERLRKLMQSSQAFGERMLIAEIMAVDLDPFSRRMMINRGSDDGLRENLPLIDAQGVMGQVIEVGLYSSASMLITDPEHALPVQVTRTGLHTVASGTGEADRLELLYLPNTAELRVGDQLITSGMGGVFPKGYPVAVVTEVKRDIGRAYIQASARPSALLDRNRDVLVVWSADQEVSVEDLQLPEDPKAANENSTREGAETASENLTTPSATATE